MRLLYLFFICSFLSLDLSGQCVNNPSLQAGDINPAPLTAGQNGTLSFNFSENLSDYTDEESDPVKILVCLLNIAPVDGINSVGGTYADHFNWQYDAVSNCFLGTQNQDILGGTGGSITVNFTQTNAVACPNNQMGFNANIQPAACMNGFNQVSDDSESSFTCALQSVDTDGDGLTDDEETTGVDDPNTPANTNGNTSDPNNICDPFGLVTTDTDNDGLTDCEEKTGMDDPTTTSNPNGYTSDPNNPDTDGDGLNDGGEGLNGTNPNDADSDDDGLRDGLEDPNGNGVIDAGESDPNNPDTDNDGINDGTESGVTTPVADPDGTGPLTGTDTGSPNYVPDADPLTTTDPLDADSDDDGLADGVEDPNMDGQAGAGETDAANPDTDNDGINDGTESGVTTPVADPDGTGPLTGTDTGNSNYVPDADPLTTTDPLDADSDDDGLADGVEDSNMDGQAGTGETDPNNPDTDNDGINDGTESGVTTPVADPDGTGPLMGTDTGSPNYVVDADPLTTTDPLNPDSDGDGVLDGTEDTNDDGQVTGGETNPNDLCDYNAVQVTETPSAAWNTADCDSDGLSNEEEVTGVDDLATVAVQPTNTMSDPMNICDPLQSDPSCANLACVTITAHVWLEGPYTNGAMSTKLNDLGYLPGQDPSTFLGTATAAGQPYSVAPWNYGGEEGKTMDYTTVGNAKAGYAATVVDWVLVSLRTGLDRATTVCTRAALLHADGHIEFEAGSDCCSINTTENYYVVIEHRNHLIVMSDQAMPVVNGAITYDFRTQESYKGLFGFGQKSLGGGVFAMYAGNGDQERGSLGNRIVNIINTDKDLWLEENGDHSSYYFNDFDLNGDVNVQDKNLWLENNGTFSDVKWEN